MNYIIVGIIPDIVVRKLDPAEDDTFGMINVIADSALSDFGVEFKEASEVEYSPLKNEEELLKAKGRYGSKFNQVKYGEARILSKTMTNFKMVDSKNREGAVIRALHDDFDTLRDQINNELNVFPAPMREMVMMTILDRLHDWEKNNWDRESSHWD